MFNKLIILVAILFFFLTFYLRENEGFYNPYKSDQRPFEMESHELDGDLTQAEKILYDLIQNTSDMNKKNHFSELLNLLQFI